MDRPDVYAQAAQELWQYGKTKISELEIAPGEGCRHPSGDFYNAYGATISGLDWITLAALRDTENTVLSYDSVDSPVAGITMWQTLTEWFEKAGYEKVFCNVGPTQVGIQGINDLNQYADGNNKIVTLINEGLLEKNDSILTVPSHWIVWNTPVKQDVSGNISLRLFSWGDNNYGVKDEKDATFFINRFFGGCVFRPLK